MTRIEKYKDYRLEIENENNAINVLSSLAKQTKEYQKKINKLNPKILENLLPTEDKYIDTVIINKEFPYKNELEELINEFKNDEAEKFTNEIEYLKNTLDNSKIIFDDGTISEN
jgi:hypothetical protein